MSALAKRHFPKQFWNYRLVLYSWGWDLRLGKGWLTWSRCEGNRHLYWSPDGTPYHERYRRLWFRRWTG